MALRSILQRLLPFLSWRSQISRTNLRADALAGLAVALVAIPQSLAYAQLAGLPAYYGLYAALIPTAVGALFGSSAQLSTGPVALTSLLTATSIAQFATAGTEQYLACVVTLALLSGLFQLAFGILRLGVLMNLLSHPVLMGFVNAAAILIVLSQIPTLVGVAPPETGHVVTDAWQVLTNTAAWHGYSVSLSLTAIVLLITFRRFGPKLPGVLISAALLTFVSYASGYADTGGHVVGDIPQGLPNLALPAIELNRWIELLPASFVIAVVSFMEAMSSAKIAAIKTAAKWDENQELIGQGLAKIGAALSQTMPVSGSFSRSALNLAANARTGVSSLVNALCVLLTVLLFTPLLKYLPQPVLAAAIVMALARLINVRSLRNAWQASGDDAIATLLTFLTTVAFAPQIQTGIVAGILVSLALFVYRRMRPNIEIVEPGSDALRNQAPEGALDTQANAVGIVRFDASLVFVNVSYFEGAVLRLERKFPGLRYVLVSGNALNSLDASGVEMLSGLVDGLRKKGIVMIFSAVKQPVRAVLERTGLEAHIGADQFFENDAAALQAVREREAQRDGELRAR